MKFSKRWQLLLGLLLVSIVLAFFAPPSQEDSGIVKPLKRNTNAIKTANTKHTNVIANTNKMILEIRPRKLAKNVDDVFAINSWTPPPPPPAPIQPMVPTAPPLPFTVLGKKIEDQQWTVFLGMQEQVFIVKANDILNNDYRVETITPPTLTLTYLPLNIQQTISIGTAE